MNANRVNSDDAQGSNQPENNGSDSEEDRDLNGELEDEGTEMIDGEDGSEVKKEPMVTKGKRGRPPGAKDWKPWEDRALARTAFEKRMWMTGRGYGSSKVRWEQLATAINEKDANFTRSGSACKTRTYDLLAREKRSETRALQTTGEGEDIEDHIQVMHDLLECFRDQEVRREDDSAAAKAKTDLEKTAGEEMRLAAMKNLVRRNELSDVTLAKGSTSREKGAQQTERKHTRRKDNNSPNKKTCMDIGSTLQDVLEARNQSDKAALEEAAHLEQERHTENLNAIQTMSALGG
ncbi:unnamed protein product [Rhizoctonia solani]|nr:unnamed protein product [Rhizoctonia solani]